MQDAVVALFAYVALDCDGKCLFNRWDYSIIRAPVPCATDRANHNRPIGGLLHRPASRNIVTGTCADVTDAGCQFLVP